MGQVEKNTRKKMYKAGKFWVAAGVTFLTTSVIAGVQASADTVDMNKSSDSSTAQVVTDDAAVATASQKEVSLGTTPVVTSTETSVDTTPRSVPVSDVPKVTTETATDTQPSDNVMSTTDAEPKVATESATAQPVEAKDETSDVGVTEANTVDVEKQPDQQVEEATPTTSVTPVTTDATVTKLTETDTTQQDKATVLNTEEPAKVQTPVATTQTIATSDPTPEETLPETIVRPALPSEINGYDVYRTLPEGTTVPYTITWNDQRLDGTTSGTNGSKTFNLRLVAVYDGNSSGRGNMYATVADSQEIIAFRKQLAAKGYSVPGYGEPDDKVWLGNIVIGNVMYENVVTVGVMQLDDQTNAMIGAYDNEWIGKITISAQTKQYNNVVNYVDDDGNILSTKNLPVAVKARVLSNLFTGETAIPNFSDVMNGKYKGVEGDSSVDYITESTFFQAQSDNTGVLNELTGDLTWTIDLPEITGYTTDQNQTTFTSNVRDGQKVFTVTYHKVPTADVTPETPVSPEVPDATVPSEPVATPETPVDVTPTVPATPGESTPDEPATTPQGPSLPVETPTEVAPTVPAEVTPELPNTPATSESVVTPEESVSVAPTQPVVTDKSATDTQQPVVTKAGKDAEISEVSTRAKSTVSARNVAQVGQMQRQGQVASQQSVNAPVTGAGIVPTTAGVVPTLTSVVPTTASIVPTTGSFVGNQYGLATQTVTTTASSTAEAPADHQSETVKHVDEAAKSADRITASVAGVAKHNKAENDTASTNDDLIKILSALALGSMGLMFFILWRRKHEQDDAEK
ncbi:KxYKxGKxW signal peptide domain-containing protein [Weissella cibaria]|uniref:KxYKxGKxW signal peptide domain-containing protein n=1 Tax=Weissella cibaria TaxID=137591 RepID=UPI00223A7172|nr:KxYKxGKxW signal peptide domain-containing protein [Weissella cibaria]MCT0021720.1 hypothetical protein [Weissella cibaria]